MFNHDLLFTPVSFSKFDQVIRRRVRPQLSSSKFVGVGSTCLTPWRSILPRQTQLFVNAWAKLIAKALIKFNQAIVAQNFVLVPAQSRTYWWVLLRRLAECADACGAQSAVLGRSSPPCVKADVPPQRRAIHRLSPRSVAGASSGGPVRVLGPFSILQVLS